MWQIDSDSRATPAPALPTGRGAVPPRLLLRGDFTRETEKAWPTFNAGTLLVVTRAGAAASLPYTWPPTQLRTKNIQDNIQEGSQIRSILLKKVLVFKFTFKLTFSGQS